MNKQILSFIDLQIKNKKKKKACELQYLATLNYCINASKLLDSFLADDPGKND